MVFNFESRESDSSYVDFLWQTRTHQAGPTFTSTAGTNWEIVLTRMQGETTLTVRGPETKASPAAIPEDAEIFGIVFKMGTFMPHLPPRDLVNTGINLPDAGAQSIWLKGSAWELPTFDNADVFINRLVRDGLLAFEPVVDAALQGETNYLSLRSVQRRFVQVTGLTHSAIRQIYRAKEAAALLENGTPILDTVVELGYSDQSHLTRSLKHLLGQTPTQIIGIRKAR
jgi:AraC-like DNA-binding protein